MFKQVGIATGKVDLGNLSDSLLYYGSVDIEVDSGNLAVLCATFGFDEVCALVDSEDVRLLYSPRHYVVSTSSLPIENHRFIAMSFSRDADGKQIRNPHDELERSLKLQFPGSPRIAKMARELSKRVIKRPYYPTVERLATEDMKGDAYRSEAIAAVLNDLVPGLIRADGFETEFFDMGDTFVVNIPIDFKLANRLFHTKVDVSEASISTSYIIGHLLTARNHLLLAAERGDDMWLPSSSEVLIQIMLGRLAERYSVERDQLGQFEKIVFEGRSFGDAVKQGTLASKDLVSFVQTEKSRGMKKWVQGLPNDANLVSEYIKESNGQGFMGRLPSRAARVTFFSGAGVATDIALSKLGAPPGAAVAGSLALGAIDEFMVGKLRAGWRPSSWVQAAKELFDQSQATQS